VPDLQDNAVGHLSDPYIAVNDVLKLAALRQRFPRLYRS